MDNETSDKIKISKEIIATLPIESFPGRIVVVDNEAQVTEATKCLSHESIIGFDTETRPTFKKGQTGTIGELAPKPHPWLYSETAKVGLGISEEDKCHVLGFEDSSAGIMSIRLAGFQAVGITGGNIHKSGVDSLCMTQYDNLCDALPLILGK